MRKIFKPDHVIKDSGSVVQIPDVIFEPEPEPMLDENGEPAVLTEEVYEKIRAEIRAELAAEVSKTKLSAVHERDSLIAKAKKDAKKLMDDAALSRRSILDDARASAEQLKREAYMEGLKKGVEEKSAALDELASKLAEGMDRLVNDENEYFDEYALQLKYLASEIAEKIIYQKIEEDDMVMYNLVKNAVRSVRSASWIKAEVSSKLAGYIDSMEGELASAGINAEITMDDSAPADSCVINTSEGFVVATVSKQLENLKEYISRQDKSGNDEEDES